MDTSFQNNKKNMHAHFSSEAGAADRGKRQLAQEQQEARA